MKHWIAAVAVSLATCLCAGSALAQAKELKVGVIYDLTGPFAAGGSNASYLGTKYAIDMFNERGGVDGWKIKPVYTDAQSKAEVAINEYERLVNQEKVDMIMGLFSSAHCVPVAQKAEAVKKFMWANVCVASAVLKDKKFNYVFRAQVHSDQFGEASCSFLNEQAKARLGKEPKDLRVAVIYEDGPYGSGVAAGNESACKGFGMQVVLKEGYAATSPDLSPLVTKLRRARADVILHTGYNPDITLFMRQAKERRQQGRPAASAAPAPTSSSPSISAPAPARSPGETRLRPGPPAGRIPPWPRAIDREPAPPRAPISGPRASSSPTTTAWPASCSPASSAAPDTRWTSLTTGKRPSIASPRAASISSSSTWSCPASPASRPAASSRA